MGYEMFVFREMVLNFVEIYMNKNKYDGKTVNPHNINNFIDGKDFYHLLKDEPNIDISELGKYSKRFLKYAKGNI